LSAPDPLPRWPAPSRRNSAANVDPAAGRSSLGYTNRQTRSRAMKVMMILKATPQSEAGQMPDPADVAATVKFHHEMHKAGVLLDAGGLMPSKHGARVTFSGKHRSVVDGPFAETKELVGGYWMLQVKELAEAIEWAKRLPIGHASGKVQETVVEIRPMIEFDFEGSATP